MAAEETKGINMFELMAKVAKRVNGDGLSFVASSNSNGFFSFTVSSNSIAVITVTNRDYDNNAAREFNDNAFAVKCNEIIINGIKE